MGILAVPVTVHGTVCRNCYDVDWARKAEAEDTKKREADAAKKAKEAIAPDGSTSDRSGKANPTSSFDNQPVTTLSATLKVAAASAGAPVAPPPTDTPGQSVNIFA